MRTFDKPNWGKQEVCPICKTAKEEPVVLVGLDGTEDGNIIEAVQVHME